MDNHLQRLINKLEQVKLNKKKMELQNSKYATIGGHYSEIYANSNAIIKCNEIIGNLEELIFNEENNKQHNPVNDFEIPFENKLATRKLNQFEQKLQEIYDEQELLVQEEIQRIIEDQISTFLSVIAAILLIGSSALSDLNDIDIRIYTKLKDKLKEVMLKNYDLGKETASKELKINKPKTPLIVTQNINAEADILATIIEQNINNEAKSIAQTAFFAGATASAIVISIREMLKANAKQVGRMAGGTIVGDMLNKGRTTVFEQKEIQAKLVAYQRNEVLDINTCPMCRSLDKRFIKPDDQFKNLTLVHQNCRGYWIPVFELQDLQGKTTGIPKFIVERFDTVGGVPIINQFKQFKKKK